MEGNGAGSGVQQGPECCGPQRSPARGRKRPLPPLSSFCHAKLIDASGREIVAKTLWAEQPVLFVLIRRPGCVLCRAEARRISAFNQTMKILGVKPVCLVHQWVSSEIDAFCPVFWQGEIYLDANKELYRALSGGRIHKQAKWTYFFKFHRVNQLCKKAKQQWAPDSQANTKGTNIVMGGVLAVKSKDKGASFCFVEDFWGDHPSTAELLEVCEEASGKKLTIGQVETQMQSVHNLMLKNLRNKGSSKA